MFRSSMRSSSGISLFTSLLMLLMLKFLKYLEYIAIHHREPPHSTHYTHTKRMLPHNNDELQYILNILRILTSATSTRK